MKYLFSQDSSNISPGLLIEELMLSRRWSIEALSYKLQIGFVDTAFLIRNRKEIDESIAIRLEAVFEIDRSFWLKKQEIYNAKHKQL